MAKEIKTKLKNAVAEIDALIAEIEEQYKKYPQRIVGDFETEEKTKKEYATRQFFELLQNADDQAKESGSFDESGNPILEKVKVKVEIKGNLLIIQNTGDPFSVEGIKSLMYPNVSPKKYAKDKKRETIGYKGLGFRSLLNWIGETGSIKVITRDFAVAYSRSRANARLDDILASGDCTDKVKAEMVGIRETEKYPIAILTQPENGHNGTEKFLSDGFATAIIIECDDETLQRITDEISGLKFNELLFLKNLERVELHYSGIEKTIVKVSEANLDLNCEVILIEEESNGQRSDAYEWHVYDAPAGTIAVLEKGKSVDKKYEIKIAYPQDDEMRRRLRNEGVIHSFFRTDERFPFPYILHATFELESNRNRIEKNNKTNEKLAEKIVEFMCATAVTMAEKKKQSKNADYEALQLVLESGKTDGTLLTNYNFSELLFRATMKLPLLPTISNEYVAAENKPKHDTSGFAGVVVKTDFADLLKPEPNDIVGNYLSNHRLGLGFYSSEETARRIDLSADKYSTKNKARLICLFANKFSYASVFPHILIDNEGKKITNDDAVVFINPKDGDEASISIPRWSRLHFLDSKLEEYLYKEFEVKTPRNLADSIKPFKVNQYSLIPVLSGLVAQAKTSKRVADVIFSLYRHWRKNSSFASDISRIAVKIVDTQGEVVSASGVFFGSEWGNEIGAKVLKHIPSTAYLGNLEQNGIIKFEKETELLTVFFSSLGVRRFPRIKHDKLKDDAQIEKYIAFNKQKYGNCSHPSPGHIWNGQSTYAHCDMTVLTIPNITQIIESLSASDIILWLIQDVELTAHLQKSNEYGDSKMLWDKARTVYHSSLSTYNMRLYLSMVFRSTAWVDTIRGEKAEPSQLLIDFTLPKVFNEVFALPKLDEEYLSQHNCGIQKALSILEDLGAVSSVKSLDKEVIYGVLLDLPEIDTKNEIGGQIYHRINSEFREKAEIDKLLTDNKNYEKFRKQGRLLCGNGKGYVDVENTVYIDKKVVCDAILQELNAVKLPRRLGGPKIERLFGAKHFKGVALDKVTPTYSCESIQTDFERQYKMLLPYIYAGRVDKDSKDTNFRALKRTRIMLCDDITIAYDGKSFSVRDYENIYSLAESGEQNIAYVKIPASSIDYHELSARIDFKISLAEIIAAIIDVSENQDYYQLIIGMSEQDIRKTYLQSNTEDNLRIAGDKFGKEIDYKTEFWETLAQMTLENENELISKFGDILGNDFVFGDYVSVTNVEKIITLFTAIGRDIVDYNRYAYDRLDISKYHRDNYRGLKIELAQHYYSHIYLQAKANNLPYSQFVLLKEEFDLAGIPALANSILTNVKVVFEVQFGVLVDELWNIELVDTSDETGFIAPIIEEDSSDNSDVGERNEEKSATTPASRKGILDETVENDFTIQPIEPQKPTSDGGELQSGHGRGGGGGRVPPVIDRIRQDNGFKGECAVYSFFKKEKREGRIQAFKWISGNAYEAGKCNTPNDGAGYDFEYSIDGVDRFFVEVKASSNSSGIEFTMSSNEVSKARKNPKCYKMLFVRIKDEKAVTPIIDLGFLFDFVPGEDWMLNSRFSIEEDGFKIKTKSKVD